MNSITDNNFSTILGKKLLKITTVAKDTGISRTTLTNLYYRRSSSISLKILDKLCIYLDCSVGELLGKRSGEGK